MGSPVKWCSALGLFVTKAAVALTSKRMPKDNYGQRVRHFQDLLRKVLAATAQYWSRRGCRAASTFTLLLVRLERLLSSKKMRAENYSADQDNYGELIKELVSNRDLRRERCRTNQARYRKKQQKYLTDLEVQTELLRGEIQQLEKQRQVVSFGIPTKETIWNIAAEYFRLSRHGFIAPVALTEPQTHEGTALRRQSHVQLEFLQSTMSIDVTNGSVRGVDALLEKWRLFSRYHDDVQLQLERLEKGSGGSVLATVKWGITITENTLRNVYPHLLVDEFGDTEWSPFAHLLHNQRVEMNGSIRFG